MKCCFVSDMHGNIKKYELLFDLIKKDSPDAVFLGGDLLPNTFQIDEEIHSFLERNFFSRIENLDNPTRFFVIMGNDDPRMYEKYFMYADQKGIIDYVHKRTVCIQDFFVSGYAHVPPTPFQLKDWERYDVSRFVDVGSISPEQGYRTVEVDLDHIRYSTIEEDLDNLVTHASPEKTIFLFHSPPYDSFFDQIVVDGKHVDHVPLDNHVGSIAIQRFIKKYQPFLTLHGHIHESVALTGKWMEKTGKTHSFSGVSDSSEFTIIMFNTRDLSSAQRMKFCL